jgi:hypothetical protein
VSPSIEYVRVDHCGGDVFVAEQFLHRTDIIAGFQQMGGEAVAERMAADGFVNPRYFSLT